MARPGVTYSEVENAALQLVAAGKIPTIENIRHTLGTGSNSTLGTHLRIWKSKQDHTQQIASKENIPEELIASLKGVWDRVMDQSETKIQAIQQTAANEITELKDASQTIQNEYTKLHHQHENLQKEHHVLNQEKEMMDKLLADANVNIAVLTEKFAGLEQQNQDKQMRIDELQRQHLQNQANLEHYREASLQQRLADQQRYENQIQQLEQAIVLSNQEIKSILAEKQILQEKNQRLMFENETTNQQITTLSEKLSGTEDRLQTTLTELSKQTQIATHLYEQNQKIQIKHDQQQTILSKQQTDTAVLLQQFEMSQTEIKKLREANELLIHDKWLLDQEKAQLTGQLKQLEALKLLHS